MLAELRLAVRVLLKSPGYSLTALITLALGIGVNTSMFSVVDALIFRSAPYPESERLVLLEGVTRNGQNRAFSEQELREIQPEATGFSSLTAFSRGVFTMTEPGRPAERVGSLSVTSGVLDTLRVQPVLGRMFLPEEFEPGKNQVALLSSAFWQTRFGGNPRVIGRTLRIDGDTVTVVGAMPRDILADVLRRGVGLTLVGLALGVAGAWGLGHFLESFMPRLASSDPVAIAIVAAVLFAVAAFACWLPARRATRVDPLVALRSE